MHVWKLAMDAASTHSDWQIVYYVIIMNDDVFLQRRYGTSFVLQTVNVRNHYVVTEKIQ